MKKSSRAGLFGIIALAVLALSLAACGGGDEGDGSKCTSGGLGTSSSEPYIICTAQDLAALANEVNSGDDKSGVYYKLADNIDLSVLSLPAEGWTPIGYDEHKPFRGNFDGGGKTVSNLAINNTLDHTGLFGVIESGSIENLGVKIAVSGITGQYDVGGVAGYVGSSSVSNCYVTGNVNGESSIGGVAGSVSNNSSISNCYTTGDINGTRRIGGIAGGVYDSTISNCYATGDVSGTNFYIGGIAGWVSDSTISNCYATGKITGDEDVGGIAGNYSSLSITIENCAALNSSIVRASGSTSTTFGRVVGDNSGGSTLTNNFGLNGMEVAGTPVTGGSGIDGDDISIADAKDQDSYDGTSSILGWDFTGVAPAPPIWKWGGTSYPLPILYWQTTAPTLPAGHPLL